MKKPKRTLTGLLDKLFLPKSVIEAPKDTYPELPAIPKDTACPTLKEEIKPPVFILLGQYRELIQMLPAFKLIHDRINMKPIVLVSHQFAEVFEGVSYVEPRELTTDFYGGMPYARIVAESMCGGVTLQPWNKGDTVEQEASGAIILQPFGQGWGVDVSKYLDYGMCMRRRAGIWDKDLPLPPTLFDRRNQARETLLLKQIQRGNLQKKPLFPYNFMGVQTMFGYVPEVQQALRRLNTHHWMVDVNKFKAERVFDWLGVFEAAVGMVTVDSYHLHLAAATKMSYMAFVEDGWNGSCTWGNCKFRSVYSEAKNNLPALREVLDKTFP